MICKLGEGVNQLVTGKCDRKEPYLGFRGALVVKCLGMFMGTLKTQLVMQAIECLA